MTKKCLWVHGRALHRQVQDWTWALKTAQSPPPNTFPMGLQGTCLLPITCLHPLVHSIGKEGDLGSSACSGRNSPKSQCARQLAMPTMDTNNGLFLSLQILIQAAK